MNTALLRLATERRLMYRKWDGLSLGHDIGNIVVDSGLLSPLRRKGVWFKWDFHEHPGGRAGLNIDYHREEVRQRVKDLMRHQIENPPKKKEPDTKLKYEGQDLYTIICFGKHYDMLMSHWATFEDSTETIYAEQDLKELKRILKELKNLNPDFEYRLVKLVEVE